MKSYSKPYRLDRNCKVGSIILYVREDIPSKLINSSCIDHDKEYFLVELNLRKQEWLIIWNYDPHKTMINGYLEYISKEIDSHSKYDFILLLRDFNSEPTEEAMKSFCQIYNFKNLSQKPTYYKNPTNPTCVDLIITNKPKLLRVRNRALWLPQNDSNSTKVMFCKTETRSTKLPQLQVLQLHSF